MQFSTIGLVLTSLMWSQGALAQVATPPVPPGQPPRVIIIETTPGIERSEVIRKVVEALERDGVAKRSDEDRAGKPIDFQAEIHAQPDVPGEKIVQLIEKLKSLSIGRVSFAVGSPERTNQVIVICPADVTWRRVRTMQEELEKQKDFTFDVRVAANNDPVTAVDLDRVKLNEDVEYSAPAAEASPPSAADADVPVADSEFPDAAKKSPEFQVFWLEHAVARDIGPIIEQLLRHNENALSLIPDERTNSLIVRGDPKLLADVEALVVALDKSSSVRGAGSTSPEESVEDLGRKYSKLEQRTKEMATRLREPLPDPGAGRKLKAELQDTVQQAFAARRKLQRAELAEFARRLQSLQKSIEMRDRIEKQIIDRRVEELLDPNVNWDSLKTASSQGITANETSIPSVSTDPQEFVPSQMVLGKTPEEFQELFVQGTDQVRKIQTMIRRWEERLAAGSTDAETAEYMITYQEQQLQEYRRKQELTDLEYREQIKLLEAVLEQARGRLAVAEEAIRFTERLHGKGYASPQDLQQAQLKRKEAGVAVQRAASLLKMYQQAGAGLVPPTTEFAVPPSETDEDGTQTSAQALAWALLGVKLAEHPPIGQFRGGVVIRELRNQGAAAKAELRVGDVLVGLDRWETKSLADVGFALENADMRPQPGQTKDVKAYVVRGDETFWAMLMLATPKDGDRAAIPPAPETEEFAVRGSVQVLIRSPRGATISWTPRSADGRPLFRVPPGRIFGGAGKTLPASFVVANGQRVSFGLREIPGHDDLRLFGSVEIAPLSDAIFPFVASAAIPIEITEEDLDRAASGERVVKVIYLPRDEHGKHSDDGVKTLDATNLEPGMDPVGAAQRRGVELRHDQVLAILRLGFPFESSEEHGPRMEINGRQVPGLKEHLYQFRPDASPEHRKAVIEQLKAYPDLVAKMHMVGPNHAITFYARDEEVAVVIALLKELELKQLDRKPPTDAADAPSSSPPEVVAEWPLFRGDRQMTGVAASSLPANLALLWSFRVKDGAFEGTAAILYGVAYIGDMNGKLYALDMYTGQKKWEFVTGDELVGFNAGPAMRDGLLYIGDMNGKFYCLNADDGKPAWIFQTEAEISSSPNFYKHNVLIGSQDGTLYCLNANSGELVWKYSIDDQIRCSPTIAGNRCFLAGCDSRLHIIDLDSGERVADVPIDGPTGVTPAVRGDRAYVGTENGTFYAVDWRKAKVAWKWEKGAGVQGVRSSPAVTADLVVFGGRDNRLHALDLGTGKEKWSLLTRGRVDSSPVVAGTRAYVGSADGRLYGVELATGEKAWEYEVGGRLLGSPAVVDGKLVIASDAGVVYCFGEKKETGQTPHSIQR